MSRWWIQNVVFYPRDKEGRLVPAPRETKKRKEHEVETAKEKFAYWWKMRGMPAWRIEDEWAKEQKRLEALGHGRPQSIRKG